MGGTTVQTTISVALQVVLTGIVGWLINRLARVRQEFKQFMDEHEFLLTTAKANSAAILKLNRRLDRIARKHG